MKIRLSPFKGAAKDLPQIPSKIAIRISETETKDLKANGSLTETFFLSENKSLQVVLKFSEGVFQSTPEGFILNVPAEALETQKTKKDSAWEISVGEKLRVSLEVDLFSQKKAEKQG